MRLVFDDIASPSVPNTTPHLPIPLPLPRVSKTPSPVAHCTRSHLAPPGHSSLVELVQYHILTAKATWPQDTLASQFAGLCQAMALSEPETTEFACLYVRLSTLNEGHSHAVLDQESGQLLEHHQLRRDPCYKEVWDRSYSNELGHLCQGIGMGNRASSKQVAGTNTFHLIPYSDIPHHKHKEIIYTKMVCEILEGKDDKNCTRITVGGNLIFYPGNMGTSPALLELIKLMLNSVISCKGAQFLTTDIKNFYLDMPMVDPEYVHIKITGIPKEFILKYGHAGKEDHNKWIYFEIQCDSYGLPQDGILANDLLCGCLEKEGYYKAATTPGL
jgi:hypothetical protein